jgi:hypothetical protein
MRAIVIAALLSATAAPAFAASAWSATLARPAPASQTTLVAGEVAWACDAAACHTTSDTGEGSQIDACAELSRQYGPLTAFVGDQPFSTDRLKRCNEGARKG